MCKGTPLKKVGFQKKNGARPHLRKKQNKISSQTVVKVKKDFIVSELNKYKNTDSVKNQSKVKIFW